MVLTPVIKAADRPGSSSPSSITSQPGSYFPAHHNSTDSFLSAPSSSTGSNHPPRLRKTSTGSFSKLSEFQLDPPLLDEKDRYAPESSGKADNGVAGVRHTALSVDASEWRHPVFKTKVMGILRHLRIPLWSSTLLTPSSIHLQKVSGALTNAVFFVTFNPAPNPTSPSESPLLTPTMPPSDPEHPPPLTPDQYPPTILLRVYGPSSDALISRTEELRILHVLSSQYGLGPKVYGTFTNGRVEQFFPSHALTAVELRDPHISRGIARRMRELHSVDLRMLGFEHGRDTEPTIWRVLDMWIEAAEEVLVTLAAVDSRWEIWVENFALHKLKQQVQVYRQWVESQPGKGKGVVFAHNDTQYGNLLRLDGELAPNKPDHYRYIVIDFEYAAPNPRGYDIANHFHEWRANYHHPELSYCLHSHYPAPTLSQREDFYRAYLSVELDARNGEEVVGKRKDVQDDKVAALEREVRIWSPLCSAHWALWGIIQGEEQAMALAEKKEGYKPDFDCLAYALERLGMFREEAEQVGVKL